ncbi:MAG: hypothetical protein MZV65_12675 [Chromatiales bacterium]|nr:hypothetical protein [Chromatiales bacterium]
MQFILDARLLAPPVSLRELAGRGVGMDVVHNEVKLARRFDHRVDTRRGAAPPSSIRLPLTLVDYPGADACGSATQTLRAPDARRSPTSLRCRSRA